MDRALIVSLFAVSTLAAACAPPGRSGDGEQAEAAEKPEGLQGIAGGCQVSVGNGSHAVTTLICNNRPNVPMYDVPSPRNQVNVLRSSFSWFSCWGRGDVHAGGNNTWYGTIGDDNGNFGFIPAVQLGTTASFDANPRAEGLPICGQCDQNTGDCPTRIDYD